MKLFAQIVNNKLHWKFSQETIPQFAPDIHIVEISGVEPEPQEGWEWNGSFFSPPVALSEADALTSAKQYALSLIDEQHGSIIQKLLGKPTPEEKDTWRLKVEIAKKLIDDLSLTAESEAFLTSAGIVSVEDRSTWSASVLSKAARYAKVVGTAEKIRDKARSLVRAARTEAEMQAAFHSIRTMADSVTSDDLD